MSHENTMRMGILELSTQTSTNTRTKKVKSKTLNESQIGRSEKQKKPYKKKKIVLREAHVNVAKMTSSKSFWPWSRGI